MIKDKDMKRLVVIVVGIVVTGMVFLLARSVVRPTLTQAVGSCTPVGAENTSLARLTTCSPSGTTASLGWSTGGFGNFWVWAGSSLGSSSYNSGSISSTSITATGLPSSGTAYVRLWTYTGATWLYNDYSFSMTASTPTPTPTSPAGNDTTLCLNGSFIALGGFKLVRHVPASKARTCP